MLPGRERLIAPGIVVALLVVAAPLFFAAYQVQKTRRIEIGSMDLDFFLDRSQIYPPLRMNGPVRHPDGSVEVSDFYGRLTGRRVELLLPYHARRSPIRLFIRCHRFGMQGTVSLVVNGEPIDEFVFVETSYPWGGIRTVIREDIAARGPLRIELVTKGGTPGPAHFPADLGVGIDRIDVEPMSLGVELSPLRREWVSFYRFTLMALVCSLAMGAAARTAAGVTLAAGTLGIAMTAWFPVSTAIALGRLWVIFPLAAVLYGALVLLGKRKWIPGFEPGEARFVAGLVAGAALAHSVIIVFPDHLPPDVPLHAIQASWLSGVDIDYQGLIEYSRLVSRDLTPEETLMAGVRDTSELTKGGSYQAPYPPFFYLLAYSVSRIHPDLRFVLEFLSVLLPGVMLVLVYFIAKTVWNDPAIAHIASLLFAVEIGVWHHANRGHAPGMFGTLFVLLFLWYLVAFGHTTRSRKGFVGFALLTMICTLSYTVALIQISLLMACFTFASLVSPEGRRFRSWASTLAAFTLGIGGALAVFYGPFVLEAITGSRVLLGQAEDFDPPASFFFLRNQLRDTVRLLQNGHALYVGLSVGGLVLLGTSGASATHRRVLWSAVASYVLLLILKDPAVIPRVFLHAKEDLFYSPIACLLLALPLTRLWRSPSPWGRPLTALIFAGLVSLSLHDKSWNANTLTPQPMVFSMTLDAEHIAHVESSEARLRPVQSRRESFFQR